MTSPNERIQAILQTNENILILVLYFAYGSKEHRSSAQVRILHTCKSFSYT